MSETTTTFTSRRFRDPRRLWDDAATSPLSLGCYNCIDLGICDGAHNDAGFYDCTSYCSCADKSTCDLVCRNNPQFFVERYREVGGFDLKAAPRSPHNAVAKLPSMIPFVEHSSKRQSSLNFPIVAISLYDLIDFKNGSLKYSNREQLSVKFGIDPLARIVLTGVDRDEVIERFWSLKCRRLLLEQLHRLDITLITPPNFSVLSDVPRTDNFHAMKRIMNVFVEMTQAGLATALHVNARTERDYQRWAEVINARTEIDCLAFEFATGAGRGNRIYWHVDRLRELASNVDRPLQLVLRGGLRVLEPLREVFGTVSTIDTDAFHKTRSRQKAYFTTDGQMKWHKYPTAINQPLDELLQHNVATVHSQHTYLERMHSEKKRSNELSALRFAENRNYQSI